MTLSDMQAEMISLALARLEDRCFKPGCKVALLMFHPDNPQECYLMCGSMTPEEVITVAEQAKTPANIREHQHFVGDPLP